MSFTFVGSCAWDRADAARKNRAEAAAVSERLDTLLTEARPPIPHDIGWLTVREHYAHAAGMLRTELRNPHHLPDPFPILLDRHNARFRAYRIGVEFRAIADQPGGTLKLVSLNDLRKLDNSRAREALAALGVIAWATASRRERAAHLLFLLARRLAP